MDWLFLAYLQHPPLVGTWTVKHLAAVTAVFYRKPIVLSVVAIVLFCTFSSAQIPKSLTSPATGTSAAPEPTQSTDTLARNTPRGTVLAFLAAARKGDYTLAAEYLNTKLRGRDAAKLAEELAFVLDHRLPAKLNEISMEPDGTQSNITAPNEEFIGTIPSLNGNVDVLLERVDRGKLGKIWLFSNQTLAAVPDLYDEINAISIENILPESLVVKVLGFHVYGLLAFGLGLPLAYILISLLNRLLSSIAGRILRRVKRDPDRRNPNLAPAAVRLLLIAALLYWTLSKVSLPLLSRQFWSSIAVLLTIVGSVWLFTLISAAFEKYAQKHLARKKLDAAASLVSPARRVANLIALFVGVFWLLSSLGVNPTTTLAGLGVGGIAIALAAQKTLENMIGGASLIADQALRIGDYFRVGTIEGTVEQIGLRSTKVRTLDRSIVTVPNGQMATMTLENLRPRDRFWFHHYFGLPYESTSHEISSVLEEIRNTLREEPRIPRDTIRVRLLGFGQSGFQVEIFAYVLARNWPDFLHAQEDLLLDVINAVQDKGAQIARPSQTVYFATASGNPQPGSPPLTKAAPRD